MNSTTLSPSAQPPGLLRQLANLLSILLSSRTAVAGLAMVLFWLGIGLLSLGKTASPGPKLVPLGVHIFLGNTILLIVIARFVLRQLVFKPPSRAGVKASPLAKKPASPLPSPRFTAEARPMRSSPPPTTSTCPWGSMTWCRHFACAVCQACWRV